MSGPAQPVMVFTMNYISMKMDMKEGIRLHFVSKKEERRQMGVSQRPADRHTKCFGGGGRCSEMGIPSTEVEQVGEAGTGATPQLVMSPGWGAFHEAEEMTGVVVGVVESFPTLWGRMNYSPPGSSVTGISQATILEQVGTSFSRGPS